MTAAVNHYLSRVSHLRLPKICVAVTGTNGKTSVATFCRQIFTRLGHRAASMGTLGVRAGDEQITPPGLTTPDAGDVARVLAQLAQRGVTHLALEPHRTGSISAGSTGFT